MCCDLRSTCYLIISSRNSWHIIIMRDGDDASETFSECANLICVGPEKYWPCSDHILKSIRSELGGGADGPPAPGRRRRPRSPAPWERRRSASTSLFYFTFISSGSALFHIPTHLLWHSRGMFHFKKRFFILILPQDAPGPEFDAFSPSRRRKRTIFHRIISGEKKYLITWFSIISPKKTFMDADSESRSSLVPPRTDFRQVLAI